MAYIKEYWKNKNLRAERAKIWTEYMEKNYTAEIEKASARTKTWTGPIQSARTGDCTQAKIQRCKRRCYGCDTGNGQKIQRGGGRWTKAKNRRTEFCQL